MKAVLNFWRLREFTEAGITVQFYRRRNGKLVITRILTARRVAERHDELMRDHGMIGGIWMLVLAYGVGKAVFHHQVNIVAFAIGATVIPLCGIIAAACRRSVR